MRVECPNCGGAHPAWDCKRPAKKSIGRVSPASINKDGSIRKNARYLVNCVCEVCGGRFEAIPNEVKRGKARSCSKSCAAKLSEPQNMEGANNPNWKGGISIGGKSERYAKKYPEKHAAHRIMTSAIRRKELIRKPCEVCGDPKTDGHHDDYSKPLQVRWLCRKHHIEAHHGRFGCTQALPVDTNNPSSPKGSGVESLRTPTEGRKGRDSTSGGVRAKLRDPSAVLTQTAAQPPAGTNSSRRENEGVILSASKNAIYPASAGTVGNKDRHTNLERSAHKGENPRHADVGKPLTQTKRPRGRPRIHPDRKAYKAQWERDKRKRLREGK